MTGDFRLRSTTIQDRALLWALHGQTMRSLIDHTWGWDEMWQRRDCDRRLTAATVSAIVSEGRAIGGLFLDDHRDAVDIHAGSADAYPFSDRAGRQHIRWIARRHHQR